MHDNDSELNNTTNDLLDTSKSAGSKIGQDIGRAGSNAGRKLATGAKNAAKKAGKGFARGAMRAVGACLKALVALTGPLLIGIISLLVILLAVSSVWNWSEEERGTNSSYSLDVDKENITTIDENGISTAIALVEPQALIDSYYKYMSCGSYTKTVDGKSEYSLTDYNEDMANSESSDNSVFTGLMDYYQKENYFYLSSDFINRVDEKLHEGRFFYPEQVIKPVYYKIDDGSNLIKAQPLIVDGKLVSMSKKFADDKITQTDEEAAGVWDFGLGSVLQYISMVKEKYIHSVYNAIDTVIDGSIVTVPYSEVVNINMEIEGTDLAYKNLQFSDPEINAQFGNPNSDSYPINVGLISSAATFSGNIQYTYKNDTQSQSLAEVGSSGAGAENELVQKVQIGTYNGQPLYKYRDMSASAMVTVTPVQDTETDEPWGFDYLNDYISHYKCFIPEKIKTDLSFRNRTAADMKLITELGLMKPFTGVTIGVNSSTGSTGATSGTVTGKGVSAKISCYCYYCNDDGAGTFGTTVTASGRPCKEGVTCALHPNEYKALGLQAADVRKGIWIQIDGVGTRRWDDICGTAGKVDVYMPSTSGCQCSSWPFSQAGTKISIVSGPDASAESAMNGSYSGLTNTGAVTGDAVVNTTGYDLYQIGNFDVLTATTALNLIMHKRTTTADLTAITKIQTIQDALNALNAALDITTNSLNKAIFSLYNNSIKNAVKTSFGIRIAPSAIQETVYEAITFSEVLKYSTVDAAMKDKDDISFLFVGKTSGIAGGTQSGVGGYVNGVGVKITGTNSPTKSYYDVLEAWTSATTGVYLNVPSGTALYPIADGKVTDVRDTTDGLGKQVTIEYSLDGKTYKTIYGGLSSTNVKTGDAITCKHSIGKTGKVPSKNKDCFYFALWIDGKNVDPMQYFYQPEWQGSGDGSIISVAATQVNFIETSGPSVIYNTWILGQEISYHRAWCCAFVSWCANEVGWIQSGKTLKTASCSEMTEFYRNQGLFHEKTSSYEPKPGDFVTFGPGGGSHIGIVVGVDASSIYTIEGNTGKAGTNQSESDGRGVHTKSHGRMDSWVYGYCQN